MARVLLKDVRKEFPGGVVAVDNANIDIADKEFVVLVGPSGCGKSTTLRMVAGLEEVTRGEIYIDDKLVNDVPPKDRDIAMVFQNYALYPHMTVYQNMAFGLKLRHYPKSDIDDRVREAAEILGIDNLLGRKPKALSGGQRQRVAVGRAIVRKPKVFLFDEPLSNLDAKLRVQTRTEIIKLHSRLQATMVYVTHDQIEAMTMGDRIVVMKDGFIQQVDEPMALYENPKNKFVAGFIGSPAMNFINGRLKDNGAEFESEDVDLELAPKHAQALKEQSVSGDIVLGIRPENLLPSEQKDDAGHPSRMEGHLEVAEPMGNETLLYFKVGGLSMVARSTEMKKYEVDQPIELLADMERAHFFDIESGERLA
jgi:multiple sugar transport system ATP-binding protein